MVKCLDKDSANVQTMERDKRATALVWAQKKLEQLVLTRTYGEYLIKFKDGKILFVKTTKEEIPPA